MFEAASAGTGVSPLAGIGSFISGVSGLFGGGGTSNRKTVSLMKKQIDLKDREIGVLTNAAEKYGIHRLSLLGSPVSSSSVTPLFSGSDGDKTGQAIESLGQGISGAASAFQTKEDRSIAEIAAKQQIEGNALENQNKMLENQRLSSEIAIMHQPGRAPGMSGLTEGLPAGSSDINKVRNNALIPTHMGRTDGIKPSAQIVVGLNGRAYPVPTNDLMDLVSESYMENLKWQMHNTVPYYYHYAKGRVRDAWQGVKNMGGSVRRPYRRVY